MKQYLTMKDVAKRFNTNRAFIKQMVDTGILHTVKCGTSRRVLQSQVESFGKHLSAVNDRLNQIRNAGLVKAIVAKRHAAAVRDQHQAEHRQAAKVGDCANCTNRNLCQCSPMRRDFLDNLGMPYIIHNNGQADIDLAKSGEGPDIALTIHGAPSTQLIRVCNSLNMDPRLAVSVAIGNYWGRR